MCDPKEKNVPQWPTVESPVTADPYPEGHTNFPDPPDYSKDESIEED